MLRPAHCLLCCTVILCCLSCKEDRPQDDQALTPVIQPPEDSLLALSYFESVFLPGEGSAFRRAAFNIGTDSVRLLEGRSNMELSASHDDHLHYDLDLRTDTTMGNDYAEVMYSFNTLGQLDIITVNFYLRDSVRNHYLYAVMSSRFTEFAEEHYTDSDGYEVWEASYLSADSVKITYDIAIREHHATNDLGITVEMMRF